MTRATLVFGIAGMLIASTLSATQITSYVDEKGRRVYVNADEQQKPPDSPKKGAHHSLVVRKDAKTQPSQPEAKPAEAPTLPPAVDGIIDDMAARHEVDPALVRAIVKVESNFNPYAVSRKGAMGLMQLMPDTAWRFGVYNAFDPSQNVEGGVRYLKYLLSTYKDLHLSLAAYNAGEKAVDRHNGVPPYPETQQYVRRISSMYRNGNVYMAASPLAGVETKPDQAKDRWGIMKHVDEKGIVHFSNTEGW